jgi:O-antigen/teichoic acid export membrane protein
VRRLIVPLAGNVAMMLLGLAATKLMAATYSPADFGLVAYVNGLTAMFAVFADLGLGLVHIKKLGDGADVRDCVRVYLTIKTALLVLVALPMSLFIVHYVPLSTNLSPVEVRPVIWVLVATWFFAFLSQSVGYTFAGMHDMTRQFVIEVARSASLLVFLVVTAGAGGRAVHLALGYLVASAVAMLVAVGLIWPHRGGRFDRALLANYRALAVPLAAGLIVVTVVRNGDGLLVTTATSLHNAGLYYAAKRVVTPLDAVGGYLGYMVIPMVASLHTAGDSAAIASYVTRLERVLAVLFAPLLAFAVLFAGPITLALLGPGYAGAAPVLALMAAGYIVATIGVPFSSLPTAVGVPRITTWIGTVSTICWLGLGLAMTPAHLGPVRLLGWGALGTAAAFLISALIRTAMERREAARLVGARPNLGTATVSVLAFAAAGAVAGVCRLTDLWPSSIPRVGLAFVVVLGLHGLLLAATGLVPVRQLGQWLGLLSKPEPVTPRGPPAPLLHGGSETEVPTPFSE